MLALPPMLSTLLQQSTPAMPTAAREAVSQAHHNACGKKPEDGLDMQLLHLAFWSWATVAWIHPHALSLRVHDCKRESKFAKRLYLVLPFKQGYGLGSWGFLVPRCLSKHLNRATPSIVLDLSPPLALHKFGASCLCRGWAGAAGRRHLVLQASGCCSGTGPVRQSGCSGAQHAWQRRTCTASFGPRTPMTASCSSGCSW